MDSWTCTLCGYSAGRPFPQNLCPVCRKTIWHCSRCGGIVAGTGPPAACMYCGRSKTYTNLSPYIPDWGSPGHRARDLTTARQESAGILF